MRCALCTTMTLGFFLAAYLFRDLIGLTVISGILWPVSYTHLDVYKRQHQHKPRPV